EAPCPLTVLREHLMPLRTPPSFEAFFYAGLCSVQRDLHALRCEWDGTQPRSGRIKHSVSECSLHRRACCLARPDRWLRRSINELDIELGQVRKAHNRIGIPVYACHPRAIELHLFQ